MCSEMLVEHFYCLWNKYFFSRCLHRVLGLDVNEAVSTITNCPICGKNDQQLMNNSTRNHIIDL